MADFIYLVQMDVSAEFEDEFNRIYDTQHVPNLLTVPGVHCVTRYRLVSADVSGVAQYAALYEIDSPDIPSSPAWLAASEKGDWATQIRPHTKNRVHIYYERITQFSSAGVPYRIVAEG